jgi:hypothetical protein
MSGNPEYVAIDQKIGVPPVPERKPRARLGRVGLHVVAVQIEARRGGAEAGILGALLVDAVVGCHVLVSVDVIDGNEEQRHIIEQCFALARDRYLAHEY